MCLLRILEENSSHRILLRRNRFPRDSGSAASWKDSEASRREASCKEAMQVGLIRRPLSYQAKEMLTLRVFLSGLCGLEGA